MSESEIKLTKNITKLTQNNIKRAESGVKLGLKIRAAEIEDIPLILEFVKGIARFENLSHLVTATEETLAEALFGKRPYARFSLPNWTGCLPVSLSFSQLSTFVENRGSILRTFS